MASSSSSAFLTSFLDMESQPLECGGGSGATPGVGVGLPLPLGNNDVEVIADVLLRDVVSAFLRNASSDAVPFDGVLQPQLQTQGAGGVAYSSAYHTGGGAGAGEEEVKEEEFPEAQRDSEQHEVEAFYDAVDPSEVHYQQQQPFLASNDGDDDNSYNTTYQQQQQQQTIKSTTTIVTGSGPATVAVGANDFYAHAAAAELRSLPSRVPVAQLDAQTASTEKRAMKRWLKALDNAFEEAYGRRAQKAEKEALRPLYVRYARLKRRISPTTEAEGKLAPQSRDDAVSVVSPLRPASAHNKENVTLLSRPTRKTKLDDDHRHITSTTTTTTTASARVRTGKGNAGGLINSNTTNSSIVWR
ncbi:hypothetical protein PPROV_000076500 [Pycnococcus provasolii]|uniref:FAM13A-like domain-containing protein n=1 Tax=Pycnococcus provasolii TaxID=41880 RepID=A0A830H948_9CHLO|nr:hypothetical protein PPROV_000076500 [Pycnococcus provasolii]|mmetsp:Transcript_13972/g.37170  ORF Transcript_13972/g.37170 Transcript_13972/m.37170 type:complete len:358 (+) Transcript_13972:48-1121(+)